MLKKLSSWVFQSHKNMQLTTKSYMQYNLNGNIFLNKIIVLPELNNENIKDILKFNWKNMAMYFQL